MPQAYGGQTVTDSAQILPGVIVDSDINASAAIAYSKLALALGIVNADISETAAIVDTKLAQIATASKVSGAAITLLGSVPAGAGQLPAANMSALPTTHARGLATKNIADASTTQTIAHGLGSAPASVRFRGYCISGSEVVFVEGAWDSGGNSGYFINESNTPGSATSSTYTLFVGTVGGGSNAYHGGAISVDETNITITWTQINGGSAMTLTFLWEAMV